MKFKFIIILGFIIGLIPLQVFSFQGEGGCTKDCSSCHSLTAEEASKILKLEDVKVSDSPVKGVWQVEGAQMGKQFKVYLDFAKKNIILVDRFIPVDSIGKPPEMRKIDRSQIPLTGSILLGKKNAKHKVIVFDDPDCPFCRKLHKEIKEVIKKRKDIAFHIVLYPLPMHPGSYEKSKSVLCKNSVDMLDDAFEGRPVPKADCFNKEIDRNIDTAKKLDITGTPFIILPDGRAMSGGVKADALIKLIDTKVEK